MFIGNGKIVGIPKKESMRREPKVPKPGNMIRTKMPLHISAKTLIFRFFFSSLLIICKNSHKFFNKKNNMF
jgi:hypothetical protein